MLFPIKSFEEVVKEIKSFGNFLMQYNQPKVSEADEEDISILKSREILIDGYTVVIHYSKSDWPTHYVEVLQITAKHMPYLPFSLVCKIGKKFLGDKCLSYLDFDNDDRKTYCWTLATDKDSQPIPAIYKEETGDCVYEGLCYRCINPTKKN